MQSESESERSPKSLGLSHLPQSLSKVSSVALSFNFQ